MNLLKLFVVLPMVLVLVLSFTVVCANPPPAPTPTPSPPTAVPPTSQAVLPAKTPSPSGLGVLRSAFLSFYEDETGFPCVKGAPVVDKESVVCQWKGGSEEELAVHLIGPANGIEIAVMVISHPARDPQSTTTHVWRFVNTAVSDLESDPSWIEDNIEAAMDNRRSYVRLGDKGLMFDWDDASQTISVLLATQELVDRMATLDALPEVATAVTGQQAIKNRVVNAQTLAQSTPVLNPTPQGWLGPTPPAATPTPRPAKPTATPVPTVTPEPVGLGVSRRNFWKTYEDAGIICHGGSPVAAYSNDNGYETWICDSPFGAAVDVKLELAGMLWDDDVVYARLTIYDPDDNGQLSAVHTLLFLQSAIPSWTDGLDWVDSHMIDALDGNPRTVTHRDAVVTIQWLKGSSLAFVIEVEARYM